MEAQGLAAGGRGERPMDVRRAAGKEGDELPIPCAVSASIPEDNQRLVIGEWPLEEEALADEGNEVWAAFLFPESNPNVPANVLWADRVVV